MFPAIRLHALNAERSDRHQPAPARRREFFVSNLESAGLANPAQRALDDLSDAAEPAAVRRARFGQVIFDPALPQPAVVGGVPYARSP